MKIITLTLNVAQDVHCYVESFAPCHENIASILSRDAGGKGINISRALCSMGVPNTAVAVIGSEGREEFERSLVSDGIKALTVEVEGRIRENITLHTKSGEETRISFAGPRVTKALLDKVYATLSAIVDADTVLTFTGSAPEGIGREELVGFLSRLKDRGVKLVIDSRSLKKEDVLCLKPFLIKPNEDEVAEYADESVTDLKGALSAASKLREQGIENVMISLGSRGAVLCCATGAYMASAPKIDALSTIGAGDSSVAGFLAAMREGLEMQDVLRTAVAYGSAACLTQGTKPPRKEDILSLYDLIKAQKI